MQDNIQTILTNELDINILDKDFYFMILKDIKKFNFRN